MQMLRRLRFLVVGVVLCCLAGCYVAPGPYYHPYYRPYYNGYYGYYNGYYNPYYYRPYYY
jgi:hypothetical protein